MTGEPENSDNAGLGAAKGRLNAMERVQLARHDRRPYALDLISRIFTDFTEL